MAEDSRIEWTHSTFNAWTGCTKVSPACAHCYAEALARRAPGTFGGWGPGAPRRRTRPENWDAVRRWNRTAAQTGKQHLVFVNSLSDWLDDEVPQEWQNDLLRLFEGCPHLTFQLLTKRPENWDGVMTNAINAGVHLAHEWVNGRPPQNVWLGITVEDQLQAERRIPELIKIPALIRFLSCEPLLGSVDLSSWIEPWENCGNCGESFDYVEDREDVCPECRVPLCMGAAFGSKLREEFDNEGGRIETPDGSAIHWVIAGGESGPCSRPTHPEWFRSLRDQCRRAGVPFFFKQWGEYRPAADGAAPESMPRASWVDIHGRHYSLEENMEAVRLRVNGHNRFCLVERTGKRAAGRLLDGVEHSEFPALEGAAS